MTLILDKTDKGREEIASRKYHLAPRMRTLLLLIDGKHTVEELLEKVAGIGLNEQSITELIDQEFIHNIAPEPLPIPPPTAEELQAAGEAHFNALLAFYSENITSAIGLRGYTLQAKLSHARSIQDFIDLRQPFLETVAKINGSELAYKLRDQLDQLLNSGPPPLA